MSTRHLSAEERDQQLIIAETFRVLAFWAPRWKLAKDIFMAFQKNLNGLESSHPEWIHPDQRQAATNYLVLLGLPFIVLLDTFLVSVVAEYCAKIFFPNSPTIISLARFLIPFLMVGVEVTLAVITVSAKERTSWDGSKPEYKLFNKIGWCLICVTPLMVMATLFAGAQSMSLGILLVAVAQAILGGLLHAIVVKGGYWIREATAFVLFKTKRVIIIFRIKRAAAKVESAADRIRIAFPVFEANYSKYISGQPNTVIIGGFIPREVLTAVEGLFGVESVRRLELPRWRTPDLLDSDGEEPDGVPA